MALRLQNLSGSQGQAVGDLHRQARRRRAAPTRSNTPAAAIALDGSTLSVDLAPREIRTVLVRFAPAR